MSTALAIGAGIVIGFILGIISRGLRGPCSFHPRQPTKPPSSPWKASGVPRGDYKGTTHRARGLPVWGTGNVLQVHGSSWDSRRRGPTGMISNPEPAGAPIRRPRGTPPPGPSEVHRRRDREVYRLMASYLAMLQDSRGQPNKVLQYSLDLTHPTTRSH